MNNVIINLHSYCNNHVFLQYLLELIWVNFGLSWLKCDTFSIIQALMRVPLISDLIYYFSGISFSCEILVALNLFSLTMVLVR